MASRTIIRKAAALFHQGLTFEAIGEKIGYSKSAIHRWSQVSQVWEDEIQALDKIDKQESARAYRQNLRDNQRRLETLGAAAIQTSVGLLAAIAQISKNLNPDDLEDTKEQLLAIEKLSAAFCRLLTDGKSTWFEATGLNAALAKIEDGK